MTQTSMALKLICFWVPKKFYQWQKKNIQGYWREIFLFHHKNLCCVYSLELPQGDNSNKYIQNTIYEYKKHFTVKLQ